MHHFPFHVNDFSRDTARFELVDIGIYLRLLMEYYSSEKPLPNDHNELAFRVGARTRPEKCALDHVLRRCFDLDEAKNEYVQKRCEAELVNYWAAGIQSRYANLCRHWEKVNKGVEKPKFEAFAQNPDSYFDETTGRVRQVTGRNSLALVSESVKSPDLPLSDSQPRTKNHEPRTIETPIVPKGTNTAEPSDAAIAEAIYALYPKKVGHGAAIKSILKALKISGLTELEMQGRVRSYAEAVKLWPELDKTYVPMPSTWFNQQRYMDDPAEWSRTKPVEPQTRFSEKKEKGAGPAQTPESPEPDWDWRGLHAEIWETLPSCRWLELPRSTRFELRQAYLNEEKKGKGGAADV